MDELSPSCSGRTSPAVRSTSRSPVSQSPRCIEPYKLIRLCEKLLESFNPAQVTLDSHVDTCIVQHNVACQEDQIFVRQVLYGVVRYWRLLSFLLDSFYHYNSGTAIRADAGVYRILAYLTLFRLEELRFVQYRHLIKSQDAQKMLVFLRYVFDERNLRDVCRDGWLKIYDKQFVDDLIAGLLRWSPDMAQLLSDMEEQVFFTTKAKETASANGPTARARRTTAPAPFNLTQPRPKPLPIEEPLPPPHRAKPAPHFKQGPTREERALQAARALNKQTTEAKYTDPKLQPFKLSVLERPTNLDKIRAELAEEEARNMTFQPPRAKPLPPQPTAEVKLNAAAILREDALYRRKQADEALALQRYEQELRDHSGYDAWQAYMRQRDEDVSSAEMERRRREAADAAQGAVRARQNKVEENLKEGQQQKQCKEQRSASRQREQQRQLEANRQKREQIQADAAQAEAAQEAVLLQRRAAAAEVRQRQADDARAVAESEAREMAEKRDIIMQLRAMDKAPKQRVREFDPTAIRDLGLLDQMSLAELQQRLAVAKTRQLEEEERQRAAILAAKQEREASLLEKAAAIQRMRRVASAQAQVRKARVVEERAKTAEAAAQRRDTAVLRMHGVIEAKHGAAEAERCRIAAEEKRIKFEQLQAAAGAAQVEENKFRELREGAKRATINVQRYKLTEATAAERTKDTDQHMRMSIIKQQRKQHRNFLSAYDSKVTQLTQQAQVEQQDDSSRRAQMANAQKTRELQQAAEHAAKAYRPNPGAHTTMQARLQSLARGVEVPDI